MSISKLENGKNRDLFLGMVLSERERQKKKFPNQTKQKQVSLHQWDSILLEEVGEFAKEVNDKRDLEAVIELAEVAAVTFKIVEIFFPEKLLVQAYSIMKKRAEEQQPKETSKTYDSVKKTRVTRVKKKRVVLQPLSPPDSYDLLDTVKGMKKYYDRVG